MRLPAPRHPDPRAAPALRWGILAPGAIANDFALALHRHTEQRVVAVASRSIERADAFARAHGVERAYGEYESLVEAAGVDVVYVAAPHSEHERLALLAIRAGVPVLIEKPVAPSAAAAQRIADAARAEGVFAMEAMWTRYLPQSDLARQLLDAGELGAVRVVSADFGTVSAFDPGSRLFDPALAGGALLDLGVYPVSFALFALPELAAEARVHAFGSLAATGVDAQAALVLETVGGAQALLSTTVTAHTSSRASIAGTGGRLDVHPRFWAPGGLTFTPNGRDPIVWEDPRPDIRGRDGFAYEAAALARFLGEGRLDSPVHPLTEAVAALRLIDEARRQLGYTAFLD